MEASPDSFAVISHCRAHNGSAGDRIVSSVAVNKPPKDPPTVPIAVGPKLLLAAAVVEQDEKVLAIERAMLQLRPDSRCSTWN